MVLCPTEESSKGIANCIIEYFIHTDGNMLWELIETGWSIVDQFEDLHRVSVYILLLFVF
jgi:hypothetical protein